MANPKAELGGHTLTDAYLEFASSGTSRLNDAEFVVDEWTTGQRTLGIHSNVEHAHPPQIVVAAAVGALATRSAAGEGSGDWMHPTVGLFPRTITYAQILEHFDSPTPRQGNAAALATVVHYWDPRAGQFRDSVGAKTPIVQNLSAGAVQGDQERQAISGQNQLYFGASVDEGMIRARSGAAITNMLQRDYGIQSPADQLRLYAMWAVVDRFGSDLNRSPTALKAHAGQFVYECNALQARLGPNTPLSSVLDARCYQTYLSLKDRVGPMAPNSLTIASTISHSLRRRKRDWHNIEGADVPGAGKVKTVKPLGVNVAEGRGGRPESGVEELLRTADFQTCKDLFDAALDPNAPGSIVYRLQRCREVAENRQRRARRKSEIEATILNTYPHFKQHDVDRVNQSSEDYASSLLLRTPLKQALTSAQSATEALSYYAAATMDPSAVSEANKALNKIGGSSGFSYRRNLQEVLAGLMPAVKISNIHNVSDQDLGKLRIARREIEDLRVQTPRIDGGLPTGVYSLAARVVMNRGGPLFSSEIGRGKDESDAYLKIVEALREEATKHYGVPESSSVINGVRTNFTDLLVACRFVELHADLAAQDPAIATQVVQAVGPSLAMYQKYRSVPEWIKQNMPPQVVKIYNQYLKAYNDLPGSQKPGGMKGWLGW